MIGINDRKLKNGLRIITVKKPGALMAINLGIKSGALYEKENEKGISHFLEHMLFTGTKNRSHAELNEEIEALGGDFNAYTDLISTVISASALSTELEKAMELMADIVRNSVISEIECERERGVILSEYKEGKEDIETITYDHLYENAYPAFPLRYDVIGTDVTIKKITADAVRKHYKNTVAPSNSIITVVSPFEHEYVEDLILTYFGSWESNHNEQDVPLNIDNRHGSFIHYRDNSEMATIAILYKFEKLDEKAEMALKILNHRLGDSDNSLLFKEIRLNRGLAYDIYSTLDTTENVNTLEIYCATDPDNIQEVKNLIFDTIESITNGSYYFPEQSLEIMKKVTRTHVAHLLDDTESLAHYILGNALEEKKLLKYIDDAVLMDTITSDDIYGAALNIFKNPTEQIILPR